MAISGIKRKRVSKKSKQSWRKHSKVGDIEEFLEEQREDERLGGPLDTVANDELFVIDSKPAETEVTTRQSRKLKATRPLKCFRALQPYTNVPDPIKKRNRVRTPEERKNALVKDKILKNKEKGILKAKEINAIAERRLYEIKQEQKEKRGEFTKDIWGIQESTTIQGDPWAEPNTKVHNLRNTGVPVKRVINEPKKKKSCLPAVELPHPGMSYNPSYRDHQNLLKAIADEEMKVIKVEEHLKRVTGNMFRKVAQTQKQGEWLVEMSEGMPSDTNKELEIKKEVDDLDHISVNPPVQNKKKSLKQRRKQKEQLELEKQLKAKKLEKKKVGDIHTIKVLEKKLEKQEKFQEKLRELRKARKEQKKLKPKILSSTKFEDPGLDFQIGQDISGNLRAIKKEGNLLSDRFKSFQKRNILEPSQRAHHKKPKLKKYTKPGHKEDWEKTVARSSNTLGRK
ncbi:ribosome biogenesis protein NOP53-like [Euwallacea fornicatus]|uniref:ribosome biogenesis protein NOP53-like n=1 Tax=Euwallacea fornicatus TaxID=995702 RepID=UPI00338E2FDB